MRERGREKIDESARRVFEPRARRPLDQEDVRQITENLTGFFGVLRTWAARQEAEHLTEQARAAVGLDKRDA